MFFISKHIFNVSTLSVFVYLGLTSFDLQFTGSTYCYDLSARVNLNESFLNTFNFYWTSFTYLPTFFFITLFIFTFLSGSHYVITIMVLFLVYNLELVDFLASNYATYAINPTYNAFNLLLINNLNKYHPFIYYMSVIVLLVITLRNCFRTLSSDNLFSLSENLNSLNNWLMWGFGLNTLALFLGSWWAQQEGTWQGWWNWDPSEVLGLLVMTNILWFWHQSTTYTVTWRVVVKLLLINFIFVFAYFFIQLNFDLVSHNFGAKFFFFFSNNLFFLEALVVLAYLTCRGLWNGLRVLQNNVLLRDVNLTHTWYTYQPQVVVLILFSCLIGFSFIPLFNYFIWTYFYINSFNVFNASKVLVVSLALILSLVYNYQPILSFIFTYTLLIPSCSTVFALFLLLPLSISSRPLMIHFFLLQFTLLNLMSNSYNIVYWYTWLDWLNMALEAKVLYFFQTSFTCDHYFIELYDLVCTAQLKLDFSSSIIHDSSAPNLHQFFLLFNENICLNYYQLSSNYLQTFIIVETNYLNNLYSICHFFTLGLLMWMYFY